jgi:flagellar protein FlaG
MSANSSSAVTAAGMARAPALPQQTPPAAVAGAERAAAPAPAAAAAGAAAAARPQLAVPKKAELTLDPAARARELQEAIAHINEQMQRNGHALAFRVDDTLNRTVIQVTNSQSGEVVRQIPNESLLRVAHNLDRIAGLLKDETI